MINWLLKLGQNVLLQLAPYQKADPVGDILMTVQAEYITFRVR